MNLLLSVFLVALSALLIRVFCSLAQNTRLMDKPNERSLHVTPTVRGGGLVFIGLSLIAIPFICLYTQTPVSNQIILMLSITLLATISFLDDLYQLSARLRFMVQCLVAALVAYFMRPESLDFILFYFSNPYLVTVFLFFTVIWAINHFNFMDGLDGFCASQALFLLATYAFFLSYHPALIYQYYCLILVCCLLGFLIFNVPPAKIFMGDVGSASLGLITFTIAVIAQQKYQIPILYWFLLNGLFLFDATVTLLRRVLNKEKWFAPHRKHAYQRLKQSGVSARMILAGQMLINLGILTLVLLFQQEKFNLIFLVLIPAGFIVCFYFLIEKRYSMWRC